METLMQLREVADGVRLYVWDHDTMVSWPVTSEIEALFTARQNGTYLGDEEEFGDTVAWILSTIPTHLARRHR